MVSARGKVLRDSEVTARDLSFKSVWRELKAEGWTRKPPPRRSLEDRYKYIRPMGHANGTVGIDFFLGEEGVLEYYANVLRSRAAASARASNVSARQDEAQAQPAHNDAPVSASGQAVRDRYVEEVSAARRRQAEDTTNTLKQRRSNFCRDVEVAAARGIAAEATAAAIASASTVETEEAESDAAAWQTNPAAAFFGGPAPTTPTRSRPVSSLIATSPHIDRDVLEVADDDTSSVATADDDTASVATADDDSAWVPTADGDDASVTTADDNDASVASIGVQDDDEDDLSLRGSELLADNNDSLNAVNADENEEQYGAIESGDEAENDDVDTGEYDSDESESVRCMPDDIVDDLDETESEVAEEVFFAEKFLESFGGSDQVLAGNLKDAVLRSMTATGWEDVEQPDIYEHMMTPYEPVNNSSSYPGLRQGYSGPTAEALRRGDSPMALFFFFLPVVLWQHIAVCSNEYHREMLPQRTEAAYSRYRKKQQRSSNLPRKTRRDVQQELESMKPIMPHELCQFVGLLIARTIAPNREKLSNHWKTTDLGAISRGCFGSVLARDRFMEISRNLHFNSNNDPRAQTDRAWKIRKLVEVLQRTFDRGYVAPSHLAFDEAVLPSRSSFNKMRVYMKDKPHKWGTKLFMLCSGITAYCIRFEVYCGKKQHASDAHKADMKSGPAAVVRNLLEVFGPEARKQGMRLIVIDRFYTSVALAIQLLLMGFYCVGTIMTNRLGYCKEVVEKKKSRPSSIERGSFKVARSKLVPNMAAISWWDSRPVHFLCTGGSTEIDRVGRQDGAEKVEVPCPRVVKDYHAFMGGVDVHDQLRLQRYSLQRSLRFRKYYKSLALGLIDLAIVNSYIVHKAYHKNKTSKPMTHVKYMIKLHLQLTQLRAADMYEGNTFGSQVHISAPEYATVPTGPSQQSKHAARQVDEWRDQDKQAKRRQRACKVCSALRTDNKRASTTSYFCGDCSQMGPVFLCMKGRRQVRGLTMTCWDIWHNEWSNGKLIPMESAKPIRIRRKAADTASEPPSTPGTPASRKKRRTSP